MEPWELAAREAIRDLVATYNQLGDAGRTEPLMELFTEDAVLEIPGRTLRGREAIRGFFAEVSAGSGRKPIRLLRHFTSTHQIVVDGPESASGRCYYQVLTEHGLVCEQLDGPRWVGEHREDERSDLTPPHETSRHRHVVARRRLRPEVAMLDVEVARQRGAFEAERVGLTTGPAIRVISSGILLMKCPAHQIETQGLCWMVLLVVQQEGLGCPGWIVVVVLHDEIKLATIGP